MSLKPRSFDVALLFLVTAWPFINFIAHNFFVLERPVRVALIGFAIFAVVICVWIVLRLVLRGILRRRAGLCLAAGVASFFSFSVLSNALVSIGITSGRLQLVVWGVLTVLLVLVLARIGRSDRLVTIGLVVAGVMVIQPTIQLVARLASDPGSNRLAGVTGSPSDAKVVRRPNVYWFLLDGYLRDDALMQQTGFDNTPFLSDLGELGFSVARRSLNNYLGTTYSVSSTLTMDYYLPVDVPLPTSVYSDKLVGFSAVVARFKGLGYGYVHAEPGFLVRKTRCGGNEDICVGGTGSILSEEDISLLRLTPAYRVASRLFPEALNAGLTFVNDAMKGVRQARGREPFFAFMHILSPHFPNRYNPGCSLKENIGHTLDGDYSDPEFIRGYIIDVGCLNEEMLSAVREITEVDKTDPIIVIMADHGVELGPGGGDAVIGFKSLNAAKFPKGCGGRYGDDAMSINMFRLVFSCIEGNAMPLLEPRFFKPAGDGSVEEVTKTVLRSLSDE
jgi:hypothetical protein